MRFSASRSGLAACLLAACLFLSAAASAQDRFTVAKEAVVAAHAEVKAAERRLEEMQQRLIESDEVISDYALKIREAEGRHEALLREAAALGGERLRLRGELAARQQLASRLEREYKRLLDIPQLVGTPLFQSVYRETRAAKSAVGELLPGHPDRIAAIDERYGELTRESRALADEIDNLKLALLQYADGTDLIDEAALSVAELALRDAIDRHDEALNRYFEVMRDSPPAYLQEVVIEDARGRLYHGVWTSDTGSGEETALDEKSVAESIAKTEEEIARLEGELEAVSETLSGLYAQRNAFLQEIKINEAAYIKAAEDKSEAEIDSLMLQTAVDITVVSLQTILTGGTLTVASWSADKLAEVASKRVVKGLEKGAALLAGEAFEATAEEGVEAIFATAIKADKAWQDRTRDYLLAQARVEAAAEIARRGSVTDNIKRLIYAEAEEAAVSRFESALVGQGRQARREMMESLGQKAKAWAAEELASHSRLTRQGESRQRVLSGAVVITNKQLAKIASRLGGPEASPGEGSLAKLGAQGGAVLGVAFSDAAEAAFDRGLRSGATALAAKLGEGKLRSGLRLIRYENLKDFKKFTPGDAIAIAGTVTKAVVAAYFEGEAFEARERLLRANLEGGSLYALFQVNQVARAVFEAEEDQLRSQLAFQKGRRAGLHSPRKLKIRTDEALEDFPAELTVTLGFSRFVPPPTRVTLDGAAARREGEEAPPEGREVYRFSLELEAPPEGKETLTLDVGLEDHDGRLLDAEPGTAALLNLSDKDWDDHEAGADDNHRLRIALSPNSVRVRYKDLSVVKQIR